MPRINCPCAHALVLHELLGVEKAEQRKLPARSFVATRSSPCSRKAEFCAEVLFPLIRSATARLHAQADGSVMTPTGFKDAYKRFVDGGWPSLAADPEYGGQGLPHVVHGAFMEMLNSANQAWGMYPGLSHGAYNALHAFGTPEQKKTYLPKLVSGEWTGTMCLTEAHCGTDLGLLKTRAVPNGDASYAITGTKIFISAGEHDLAQNILHLVLARLPDAPAGTKGISLFICRSSCQTKRRCRRAQWRRLRIDRTQDGHPRQRDLRNQPRRRAGLDGRRAESRPKRDVRDDEQRAPRCRHAIARTCRSRVPELTRLRE